MSRSKKKRDKPYRGSEAKLPSEPVIHRVEAVDRGRLGQWWYEKKRLVKTVALVASGLTVFVWMIVELFRAIF